MPEMQKKYNGGHHARFGDKVDHTKSPNLVIVAVAGFIYFWRKKWKPFDYWKEDTGEIQFKWIHLVNYYYRKPSFTRKIVQNPFLRTRMPATMVVVFGGAVVKKTTFF